MFSNHESLLDSVKKNFADTEEFSFFSPAESEAGSDPASKEEAPSSEAAAPPAARALVNPEDLETVKPGSSLKTVRSLRRPTNLPGHFFTSSSVIGAHDGAAASSEQKQRCLGCIDAVNNRTVHTITVRMCVNYSK